MVGLQISDGSDKQHRPKRPEREVVMSTSTQVAVMGTTKLSPETEKLWAQTADRIIGHRLETMRAVDHAVRGQVAIGAQIVELSRSDRIKSEFKEHMKKRDKSKATGRKPSICMWIARLLFSEFEGMPTAKHMGAASNAALKLEKGGKGTIRELLGWTTQQRYNAPLLNNTPDQIALPEPKQGNGASDKPPAAYTERMLDALVGTIASIQTFIESADKKGVAYTSGPVREAVSALRTEMEKLV